MKLLQSVLRVSDGVTTRSYTVVMTNFVLKKFAQNVVRIVLVRLGSATPKVRHSEGPPFRRSGPPKTVTNPNPNPNPI